MAARVRAFDWGSTDLGPSDSWSPGLRQIVEMVLESPLVSTVAWGPERLLIYNDAAAALYGASHPGALGRPLARAFPSSYPEVASFYERVFGGEAVHVPRQTLGVGDRSTPEVFDAYLTPIRDESGEVRAVLMQGFEIGDRLAAEDALRQSERRLRMLIAELQHRVRNVLAVIRALVSRTAETSETVEEFTTHLLGRLNSMARTQVILTRSGETGVNLENIIRDELRAQAAEERRLTINGPEVRLSAKAAEVLTLAVHELTTNAIKYGALGAPKGHVDIRWGVREQEGVSALVFDWKERGVRVAAIAPRREGFGTQLIEKRVPYELKGTGNLRILPGGIICQICFPLVFGSSLLEQGIDTA